MSDGGVSVGEALVGLLEAYGVTDVFGIPGVHNVEMYRALPRSGITHVLSSRLNLVDLAGAWHGGLCAAVCHSSFSPGAIVGPCQ